MVSNFSWWRTLVAATALAAVGLTAPGARAVAQQGGAVAGQVTDERGAAVAGAQVLVDQTGKGGVSGPDGRYQIAAVSPGSHVLHARIIGYRSQSHSVTVTAGKQTTQDFTLAPDPLALEAVVVTGTETPRTKLESSNAVTVLTAADVTQAAPRSTTEVLRYVPGFTRVESSGGEVNENITMRGILGVEYVMFLEDGLPVFPTMHTFFMNADNLFRMDENIERTEVVRGAGSALFGSNTPGAIINFINKTGGPELRGSVRAYGATGGLARTDFNVNGPIGDDWRFNVGAFYRYDQGVRDPGFPGSRGGQFKASLTRNLTNGFLRTSLKVIDDHSQFILPLPFSDPNNPQYVPGFGNFGSMNTAEGNHITVPTPTGTLELPLDDGLRTKAYWLTANLGFNLPNDWGIDNAAQIMQNDQGWNAILPFDVMTRDNFVTDYLQNYWGNYYAGPIQGRTPAPGLRAGEDSVKHTVLPGTQYHLVYTNRFDAAGNHLPYSDANNLLSPGGEWHVSKPLTAFQDQFTVKKNIPGGHNVSLGVYFANYTQTNRWFFTDVLMNVANNPNFVDLVLDTATVRFIGYKGALPPDTALVGFKNFAATKNGFRRFLSNYANGSGATTIFSGVLGGTAKLSDRLRADAGVRWEYDNYVQTAENSANQLVSDTVAQHQWAYETWGNNSYRHVGRSLKDWAGSVGLNYSLNPQTSIYALGARAYKMPALDEFLFASVQQQVDLFTSRRNYTGEVGIKHAGRRFGVTLDGFYTVLKNIVSQGLVTISGQSVWIIQTSPENRAYGAELEASGRTASGWGGMTNWTVMKADFPSCPAASTTVIGCPKGADVGTLLAGVPPVIGNLAVSYSTTTGITADADWHFVAKRYTTYADSIGHRNALPSYNYLNVGAQYVIPNQGITLRADLLNVYQSKGLEEGNPRLSLIGGLTSNLFLARPILPRRFQVSMGYQF